MYPSGIFPADSRFLSVALTEAFDFVRFVVLEPRSFERRSFSGRLYCTEKALWKFNWFLRDFGYDMELLNQDQFDDRALLNLRGVVRTSHVTLNGHTFQNLEAFAPETEWEELSYGEGDADRAREIR
jgi:hypothetical protein